MQKRAQKTRAKILKTAGKLYSLHGFHGTSVDLIAEKAGVNKQRIYAYFQNKAGLFEACLLEVFESVNEKDKELLALTKKDIPQMTRILLSHYFESHEKHPDFWRIIAWANLENKPFYKCLEGIKEESFSHLRSLYKAGQSDGVFPEAASFETYIFSVMAVAFFYCSNRKTLEFSLSPEIFKKEAASLIKEAAALFQS
jgi:TetR/AcrR family transcriptional regulator